MKCEVHRTKPPWLDFWVLPTNNWILSRQGRCIERSFYSRNHFTIFVFSYAQFYDTEHSIVNKYPDMIAQEVDRYRNEMLIYFRARQVSEPNASDQQYYTTALGRITYELDDFTKNLSEVASKRSVSTTEKGESKTTSRTKSRSEVQSRLASIPDEEKQPVVQTFLTEDLATITDTDDIPFYEAFQIPSNLVQSIVFEWVKM